MKAAIICILVLGLANYVYQLWHPTTPSPDWMEAWRRTYFQAVAIIIYQLLFVSNKS